MHMYVCVGILICLRLFQSLCICAWVLCEEVASYPVIWYLWVWISMNVYKPMSMGEYVCGSVSCCVPACSIGSGHLYMS